MACSRPLVGYMGARVSPTGKSYTGLVVSREYSGPDRVEVPCGQCWSCRLARSREKAIRAMHTLQSYGGVGCFLTLTYRPETIPAFGALVPDHVTLFLKRLRYAAGVPMSYLLGGEYGEKYQRPHYHLVLFGYDFPDRTFFMRRGRSSLYRSELLERLWPHGFCTVGDCTFESAAYVARYTMKKITGPGASDHYERLDPTTGELQVVPPEYGRQSLNPPLGKVWLESYWRDVYPHDYCVINGFKTRPPRYYDKWLEKHFPDMYAEVKFNRQEKSALPDNPLSRIIAREIINKKKYELYSPRTLENWS